MKLRFNRGFLAVISLIIIVAMLSACAQTTDDSESVEKSSAKEPVSESQAEETLEAKTLTVWNCDNTQSNEEGLKHIIDEYMAQNPSVTVEYTGLPWDNAKEKFDTAIATGTAPDCAYITQQWAGSLAGTGGLVSLNDYVDAWDIKDEFDFDLIYSSGLAIEDELYMMPFEYGTTMCWYRADWYKKKGLSAPTNFDEFFSDISAMTDASQGRFGFGMRGGNGGSTQLECFLVAYSGSDSYFLDNGECFVSDEKVKEGFQKFVDLYNVHTAEGDINNGYTEMCAAFGSDIAAMIYHNNSSYPDHVKNLGNESKFGAFILPKADNGVRTVGIGPYGYSGWVMFTDSKDYDATWDYISFACDEEMQNYWNQIVGGLPTNLKSQNAEWVDGYPALVEIRNVMSEPEVEFCVIPAYYPDYASVHMNILQPGFQAVLLGEKTVEEYLSEWNEAMKDAKADYETSIA